MTDQPRDVIAQALSPIQLTDCPDSLYRRELADAILAALSAAGLTICREQVGWLTPYGSLRPLSKATYPDERPLFVPVESGGDE